MKEGLITKKKGSENLHPIKWRGSGIGGGVSPKFSGKGGGRHCGILVKMKTRKL